ncbi:hypothetical protein ACIQF6_15595 [Kitasatospora sp. NPDC092948]|uniref:hypothetical protein n=1 Tax=Kitasatospora sp. NPDC092948 TaxID=3364088 RepID=UPI0037FC256D
MSPIRAARRTAFAAVLLTFLAGCSGSAHHETGDRVVGLSPGESPAGTVVPQPSRSDPPPVDPAHWPTGFSRTETVRYPDAAVIRAEYTGEAYLNRLAATWHVTLEAPTTYDFPRPGLLRSGHNAGTAVFWIAATWAPSGSLLTVTCTAATAEPRADDFLADCARLDYPDSTPAATARWVHDTWPGLHTAAAGLTNGSMESPPHRSGPVAVLLHEGTAEAYGGAFRNIRLFGLDQD